MLLLSSCGGGGAGPLDIGPPPPVAGPAATINYISATPPVISIIIAPTGPKSSVMRFIVRDALGNSVADGTVVDFVLTGPSGGKTVANGGEYIGPLDASPTTDSTTTKGGTAETVLVSGRVAGPATVTASVAGTAISTVSGAISIGGGVPASNHFRLASTQLNLAAIAGKSATIGAFLADRFGNVNGLVGTSVSFMAEGGAIGTSALADFDGIATVGYLVGAGFPTDGRVTIMAATQGEEVFVDTNGNGLYDIGEAFVDRSEPFLDLNHNGLRDADESYIDVNGNGIYDGPNGLWDGPDCPAAGCVKPATIWTDMELTLSTDAACQISPASFGSLTAPGIADGGSLPFTFIVQDLNGNGVIGGTTIVVTKTAAEGTLGGTTSVTIPDGAGPTTLNFTLSDSSPGNPVTIPAELAACPAAPTSPATCPTAATVTVTVTMPADSGLKGCSSTSIGAID
ncbi:MAG: hypothetical protein A2150_05180 [Candidatus Muproteobacteria bacterium RBG_16_64_11]|uniref:Big-1 domain-containing protein n=1 Tax=Candidatus Muproteobacteria bacterium RBG_16_64_11 TaxID=1817758 RepID=A0A1F6TEB8_9PROT|nr:MAG: hypothetical protein A2150_05180 [Candidatus Muproteobacteria bacterium RBG_16_64_11]